MTSATDGGSFPGVRMSEPTIDEIVGGPVDQVIQLLDRVAALTLQSAASFDAGASDDGLELLEARAPLFSAVGELLERLSRTRIASSDEGAGSDSLPGPELERLGAAAGELGRLDAAISAKLISLREEIERDLKELKKGTDTISGYLASEHARSIDLRG